jgi:hypothetical protein
MMAVLPRVGAVVVDSVWVGGWRFSTLSVLGCKSSGGDVFPRCYIRIMFLKWTKTAPCFRRHLHHQLLSSITLGGPQALLPGPAITPLRTIHTYEYTTMRIMGLEKILRLVQTSKKLARLTALALALFARDESFSLVNPGVSKTKAGFYGELHGPASARRAEASTQDKIAAGL